MPFFEATGRGVAENAPQQDFTPPDLIVEKRLYEGRLPHVYNRNKCEFLWV